MVYDNIDLTSKIAIAEVAEHWLSDPLNLASFKQTCLQHNIFNERIPEDREDADLVRLLLMVGCGGVVPIITQERTDFGLRLNWAMPMWLFNAESWQNLMLHVEQMLESNELRRKMNLPVCMLEAALDRFHVEFMVKALPKPPNTDKMVDAALQEDLKGQTGELSNQWRKASRIASKRTVQHAKEEKR